MSNISDTHSPFFPAQKGVFNISDPLIYPVRTNSSSSQRLRHILCHSPKKTPGKTKKSNIQKTNLKIIL